MKALGNKSLSSVLSTIINVIWWAEWVSFIVILVVGMTTDINRNKLALGIPVNFSYITIQQIHPANNNFPLSTLRSGNGNLFLQLPANWQNTAIILISYLAVFAMALIITYQLKTIFADFKRNLPFNKLNVSRIRNIAVVLLVYSVVQWVFTVVSNYVFIHNLKLENIQLTHSFNMLYAVMAFVLLVVAGIFKMGLALEEENKLTI